MRRRRHAQAGAYDGDGGAAGPVLLVMLAKTHEAPSLSRIVTGGAGALKGVLDKLGASCRTLTMTRRAVFAGFLFVLASLVPLVKAFRPFGQKRSRFRHL